MLDLLYALRVADGAGNDNAPTCCWQDLPGTAKLDNEDREVALTANYEHLLRRLKDGAPSVIETLENLATAANTAGHSDAATDVRVASGWLRRLDRRDFTSTTWDSDYSRLGGFWACLRDAQVGLEKALREEKGVRTDLSLLTVIRYVDDLAQLQSEVDRIERSRTTLAQKVWRRLSGTMAALQSYEAAVVDEDDFWNEQSVGSSKT